ncbi:hypothetical protein ABZW11_26715 [Nonomuraea sp. NPDC004580]|uniref:hypothetical protein n=1 Tax=Nonomuraea sp. NPDC004580 TaxID=3154552 RepID=UPI0033A56AF4
MLKRTLMALTGVVLIWAGLTGPSNAATADIAALDITAINYNSYGADSVTNNTEYVEVKNTTADPVNVANLLVQDAWARGRDKTTGCNTFRLAPGALPVETGATADQLPAGAVLRLHMGKGTAGIDRSGVRHVYRSMPDVCGYHSNVFNNGPSGSNRWAAWDTAWITLGTGSKSKGYNFSFGYVAK